MVSNCFKFILFSAYLAVTDMLTFMIFIGPIYVTTERIGNGWIITNVYYGKFEIYDDNNNLSIIV